MTQGFSQRPNTTDLWLPEGMVFPPGGDSSGAGVTLGVSTTAYARYFGRCPIKNPTTVTAYMYVTTAAATIIYSELALFVGAFAWGGGATLTRVGVTDTSAIFNSTGYKAVGITVSGLNFGDDMWLVNGDQATTTAKFRASMNGLGDGTWLARATTQPSTVTPQAWPAAVASTTVHSFAAVLRIQ